jgi:hypothetical protein
MVTPAQAAAPVTAEPVPVAVYCRTSTVALQDPVACARSFKMRMKASFMVIMCGCE